MMKRKISLFMAAALVLTMFVGCKATKTDTVKAEALVSGQKYTVQFWHELSGTNLTYLNTMIQKFNDTHPNIQVVATAQGSYADGYSKLQQAIASGSTPDICQMERAYIQYFATNDALLDLTPYAKASNMNLSDFTAGLMGHSYYESKLVALPFNRSTPILYVNKTLLDSKGLKIPQTWDELKTTANALVEKDSSGSYTRYGMTMVYDTWYPIAMLEQTGGKLFNDKSDNVGYTDAQMENVFNFLKGLQSTGALYYPPTQSSGDVVNQMFANQKVAMLYQSTGVNGTLKKAINGKFEYVTALMPKDKKYATPTGGAELLIPEKATNKAAAWEFMKWVMTDENGAQNFVAQSGYLPFTKKMAQSQQIKDLWSQNPNMKTAYDQLQYGMDSNKSVNWPDEEKDFFTAIQAMMYDNANVKTTLATMKANFQRDLKQ